MNTFNKMMTVIAISALAAGCATDDDLGIDQNETATPMNILEALNQETAKNIEMDILLDTDVDNVGLQDKSYLAALAGITQEPAPTVVFESESRVLDPEDISWNPPEPIDGARFFAFEPDGAGEYIRNAHELTDNDEDISDKEIDDDDLWGADQYEDEGKEFDIDDGEEDYDEVYEDEGEEDED